MKTTSGPPIDLKIIRLARVRFQFETPGVNLSIYQVWKVIILRTYK
jgi:hypothetical protein